MIERQHAEYEVREVPYGKVYSWNPGRLRIECECGSVMDRDGSEATEIVCECGANLEVSSIRQDLPQDDSQHPWLEDYEEWREEKEANDVKCEYYAFVEVGNDS